MTQIACVASLLLVTGLARSAAAGPFTDAGHPIESMTAWASAVEQTLRGPIDIDDPGLGLASFGSPENALGEATGESFDTLSLGDGGSITLYIEAGIRDDAGDDLAVYENGFFDLFGLFAELAFVEVSTDGVVFARFDSDALNGSPVDGGESLDPTDYDGLAGRHAAGLGSGFDLADLAFHPLVLSGDVRLDDIRFVRIVDVIGNGTTLDGAGRPVFDPYATPFPTGGFDLDAIGVIHVPEPAVAHGLLVGIGLLGLFVRTHPRRAARLPVPQASSALPGALTGTGLAGGRRATSRRS
jgi:hypothetical protein